MLSFTDQQYQNISKDTLLLPALINDPATGYIAQKSKFVAATSNLLLTDQGNKVFSDFYIDVCSKYHAELVLLNNIQRTNYLDSDLVAGGNGDLPHYVQSPPWRPFAPKKIDSVVGLPNTTLTTNLEVFYTNQFTTYENILKTGFTDNAYTGSGTIAGTTFTALVTITGVSIGHRMLLNGAGGSFIATVTTTPTTSFNFTVLYGTSFTGSATASGTFSGFTNAQRGGTSSTSPNTSLFTALTGLIDSTAASWKTYINGIKSVEDSNSDLAPRKAHNLAASVNCASAITIITNYQALPSSTTSGRFTNSGLLNLENLIPTRTSFTSARISEIVSDLGAVVQSSDGTYTPTGAYGELFKNIDLRIARAGGSLYRYNNALVSISFFDKKILTANDQLTQYNNTFAITRISSDTVIGQIDFPVASVTDFSIGDSVKVMDNDSIVYSRTISNILAGNIIRLSSGIPSVLTNTKLARIVKMK